MTYAIQIIAALWQKHVISINVRHIVNDIHGNQNLTLTCEISSSGTYGAGTTGLEPIITLPPRPRPLVVRIIRPRLREVVVLVVLILVDPFKFNLNIK